MKFKKFAVITVLLFCALCPYSAFASDNDIVILPPSPEYVKWLESLEQQKEVSIKSEADSFKGGVIPSPIDRSHLWKNPPKPRDGEISILNTLPDYYDLREQNRLTPVKNQNPWGTCWAHASLASMESTYKTLYSDSVLDLSEMFVAYFVYGDTRQGKSFGLNYEDEDILDQGGNFDKVIALTSRLGFVRENILPYPSRQYTYTAPDKFPEEYPTLPVRLRDTYSIGYLSGDKIMNVVKELVIKQGALGISYCNNHDNYSTHLVDGKYVKVYYYNGNDSWFNITHAVNIVGWDDNFSRMNFPVSMRPTKDGAWLVRNSWGTDWGDDGYFWMSYEQYIVDTTLLILDDAPEGLKHYGYDDLGYLGSTNGKWSANIFKTESDEILQYVGFYTIDNNTNYEIYVYDLGTEQPDSPINGTLTASKKDGYNAYSGYHTEDFSQNAIKISKGHYFSVVVKTDTGTAIEKNYSSRYNAVTNLNESYYSSDGTTWRDAVEASGYNVCIKAFTIPNGKSQPTPPAPVGIAINDTNFPDFNFQDYVKTNFDIDSNGALSYEEINNVTSMKLYTENKILPSKGMNIVSLKGIEFFTALTYLDCKYNQLTALDISKNTALTYLNCYDNQLKILDVSKNTSLTYLDCRANKLTNLDVSKNTALTHLDCCGNKLTTLDISRNTALSYLDCGGNKLITLDVSKNTALTHLDCRANKLTNLDVSKNTALSYLDCGYNQLTLLNLGTIEELYYLNCSYNQLTTLDVGKNTLQVLFDCSWNQLMALDLSNTYNGIYDCGNQKVTGLTVNKDSDGYYINLKDYLQDRISKVSNVIDNDTGASLQYDSSTGIIKFSSSTTTIRYNYDVGRYMPMTVYIIMAGKPEIITESLPDAVYGAEYSAQIELTGGTPTSCQITQGKLPSGLTLNNSGLISGTPTQTGEFQFAVKAGNIAGSDEKELTLNVTQTPSITTAAYLKNGIKGKKYSVTLKSSGTESIWTKTEGSLPDGLTLANTGEISGTPTNSGTFSFTVKASNSAGEDSKIFIITISDPDKGLEILTTNLKDAIVGVEYNETVKTNLPIMLFLLTPYYEVPSWLDYRIDSYDDTSMILKGTPDQAGTYTFYIDATDGYTDGIKQFTLTVKESQKALTITTNETLTPGNKYENYAVILSASGTTPITWEKTSGTLPKGLSLSNSGIISGIPTESGKFSFTVKASNTEGEDSRNFTIAVYEAPTITTGETLPAGAKGENYSVTLEATGTTPITWWKTSGDLPNGLTLNKDSGLISGTPTKNGSFSFTVRAINTAGYDSRTFTIIVSEKPVITTSATLKAGIKGESYSVTLEATGTKPITWEKTGGNLPDGLTLSNAGVISGTPTKADNFSFIVKASNTAGYDTRTFTITVSEKPAITTNSTLKAATKGEKYSVTLEATGTTPITWTKTDGNLPNGLTLNKDTGIISGTPTKNGSFSFTVKASNTAGDDSRTFSITVSEKPVITTSATLKAGTKGEKYSVTLEATGTTPITWEKTGGDLPNGLTLSNAGVISGTLTNTGNFSFTVKATNSAGYDSKNFTINVSEKPTITTSTTLQAATKGEKYSATLEASGTKPITWEKTGGNLPDGLTLNKDTGAISGTPTKADKFSFTVKASNSAGYDSRTFTIIVSEKPAITTNATLKAGTKGEKYSVTLEASGTKPITWEKTSGSLPNGLTLSNSGAISGTPTKADKFSFTVKASNTAGDDSRTFSITVSEKPAITTNATLKAATKGENYSVTLEATGTTPITWEKTSGNLPDGLTLNKETGAISGTPTKADNFSFTVKASNSAGNDSRTFTITVSEKPAITTNSTLKAATKGENYSVTLEATGTTPITWTKTDGDLPNGLTLNKDSGVISGTPTKNGSFSFTVKASNTAGDDSRTFSITVSEKPVITTSATLKAGTKGENYSVTLEATGTTPITWEKTSGNLPDGLKLNKETGAISGTPTKADNFSFTVKASNSAGNDSRTFTITVSEKPVITTNATLKAGTKGEKYSVTLEATGTTPITWTKTSGNLPDGLTLSNTGAISGTPTKPDNFSFTVKASNSAGHDSRTFTITVSEKPAITTNSTLKAGSKKVNYSVSLEAAGTKPITWTKTSGNLPGGLTLNEDTGIISGIPTETGDFTFTLEASNTSGKDTRTFTISISDFPSKPKIKTKSLPAAPVNKNCSIPIDFTGTSITSISLENLPEALKGLSIDEQGNITGTPTAAGKFNFTVKITNPAGTETKKISLAVFGISKKSLPIGTSGKSYKGSFTVTGAKLKNWSISSGDFPPGLTLKSGKISGKPTQCGTYNFTVRAGDESLYIEESCTITINPVAPKIKTSSFKTAYINNEFIGEMKLSAGDAPITWSAAGLPEGLEIDSDTGIITGTPKHNFSGKAEITAENQAGSNTKAVKFTFKSVKPKITTKTLDAGTVGEIYNDFLEATGSEILKWSWSGKTPPGLTLNESGDISGTPTDNGKFKFTVTVQNEGGKKSKKFTLVINNADSATNKDFADSDSESESQESPNQSENEIESQNESTQQENQQESSNNLTLDSAALSLVSNDDFMIAAILPDVKVDESGIYEFTVSLDKSVPEDAKLIWHLFPNGQISDSEDDNTATFFNDDGQEIFNVPEDYCVIVSAWFEAGITYKPVIAVKLDQAQ